MDFSSLFFGVFHSFQAELLFVLTYAFCASTVILSARLFGRTGLFVFYILCLIAANIQVLKASPFSFFSEPVALGTIVFSMTFLVVDIVTECYSARQANTLIWIGFFGSLIFTLMMLLTLYMPPVEDVSSGFYKNHLAIETLFKPGPAIFMASLTAYLIGQFYDVYIFKKLKELTGYSGLWLRSLVSTLIGSFLDTIIFSVLAWKIFAIEPVDTNTLIWSYIIGTYFIRILTTVVNVPITYKLRKTLERQSGEHE